MKHLYLALAVLLGGAVGLVHADYVKIILNLAAKEKSTDAPAPGGADYGSGGYSPDYPMDPMQDSSSSDRYNPMQAGGYGGATTGGGLAVIPGQLPATGGYQGQPGTDGSYQPGGVTPGAYMMGGMEGVSDFEEPESSPFYVECVVELDAKMHNPKMGWHKGWKVHNATYSSTTGTPLPPRIELKHQWGTTHIYVPADIKATPNSTGVVLTSKELQIMWIRMPTVSERYDAERKRVAKEGNKPEDLVKLAQWALGHGLINEIPKLMGEVAKADPKHPSVLAFKKVEEDLKRDLSKDDGSEAWREKLGDDYKSKSSKHYTILYDNRVEGPEQQRLDSLEEIYREFYYWFALRGKALPMPQRRLLAVLVESQEAFEHQHKDVFDSEPMTADGFYVPRDNLAVFSARRLDEGFDGLEKTFQPLLQTSNWTSKVLLDGKGWRNDVHQAKVGHAQVLALMSHALQQESERTTVSFEGTRQLVRAIGLVPANVRVPQWLDFGVGSFFETPKGAFWRSTGTPSWNYLVRWKSWEGSKPAKLDRPDEALRHVITDRYFHVADDKKQESEQDKAERKAHTMAWALVYYLAQERRDGLVRYYQELSNMPRDMEFDEDVLLGVFARAFDLTDVTRGNQVDQAKLATLANSWYRYMRLVNLEATAVMHKAVMDYKQALVEKKPVDNAPPRNPANPNQPPGAPNPYGQQGRPGYINPYQNRNNN